ncbi:MAG TPA: SulP family inorganic anion transporter [Candidatus Limnocylindrales bacterium]|nr:SulP family inorganic anion transporter [Candidatus Limnocylindrales bacterium]
MTSKTPDSEPVETPALPEQPEEKEAESRDDIGWARLSNRFITAPSLPKFDRRLLSDLIAGATFAAVNIPQSLGHAQIAGVNPVFGLYTLMFAMPVAALTTSAVFMNVSTTSALAVAVASTLAVFPASTPITHTLIPLVLLVGLVQVLFGVFRLGFLMRFVPRSVMVGFMTGVAVLIILGQFGDLTGFNSNRSNTILALLDTILNIRQIQLPSLAVGVLTMLLIVAFDYTPLRKYAMVIAIALTSALVQLTGAHSVALVSTIANLPNSLPAPLLPNFEQLTLLLPAAVAIAIVGLVQGAAVSQSYTNPDGKYPKVSRDFLGQGLANIVGSLFSGIPAGGSASGTALIVSAGQQSRMANVFAAGFVILGVLLLSPLIGYLAMPALAGLLIVVGIRLIDLAVIRAVVSTGLVTATALIVTFATTMVLPLQFAVFVGVGLSIMLNVFRQSNKVRVVEWKLTEDGHIDELPVPATLEPGTVTAVYIYGMLESGGTMVAESSLPDLDSARHTVVIIGLRGREDVGSTFIEVVERASKKLRAQQSRLMLSGVSDHVYLQLERTGALEILGRENVFMAKTRLRASLKEAMAAGRTWLDSHPTE